MNQEEKPILVVDATELDDYELCPFRWHAVQELNLRSRDPNVNLERGGLLHDFLEFHYTLKRDTTLTLGEIIETVVDKGRIKALEYISLDPQEVTSTIFQYREYCRYYENETWIPLYVEQPFIKEFFEDEHIKIAIAGKPDLVFKYGGTNKIAVADHKRLSRSTEYSPLRNQFMFYAYVLETDTVIANKVGFQKTKEAKDRFQRQSFVYYQEQIEEWREEVVIWCKKLVISQQSQIFERNRTSCDKYSGCFLHKYCITRPKAREFLIGSEYVVGEPWDVSKRLESEKK